MQIAIVGLPNVGKSTLFNALTKSANAAAENFPFCTIDPNVGMVEVPDLRLAKLAEIVHPERIMHSTVEFVDIAGLVAGASKGEGLGNQFLSHIRECDAICHVLRDFEDTDVHHVAGKVDPDQDLSVIMTELILADLESVNRQTDRVKKKAQSGDKESRLALALLEKIKPILENGELVSTLKLDNEEQDGPLMKQFQLLTRKPYFIVANVSEDRYATFDVEAFRGKVGIAKEIPIIPICAKIESELIDLTPGEAAEFLSDIGAKHSGLENLARGGFELLKLQSYFTAGVKEVRAWTIRQGATAPQAAGVIHTDFEKGFIRAEVTAYEDYVAHGGEAGAKEAGKMRTEGKDYVVKDGDVMHFRFSS